MKKLIIFPYNGNGLEAMDCVGDQYELIGFADDTKEKQGVTPYGVQVFSRDIIRKYSEAYVLAVPGSPASYMIRNQVIDSLQVPIERFGSLIHPNARVSDYASIGFNTLIMAGVVVTSNAIVGNHVCILPNSVIHHDSSVGDYTLIGANVTVAGSTKIGAFCYIGSGTSVINGISIGDGTLVGLGSNVIKALPSKVKAVGNPAKII